MIDSKRTQDIVIDKLGYHMSEAVLYGYAFIKYKTLSQIFASNPILIQPNEVNVFIDMTQLLMPLYKFDNIASPIGLLATMLNLPLHYRHYFNRMQIKSNIFLIYSSNDSLNLSRFMSSYDYKHKMNKENNKTVHDIISHNIELMSTIIPYFPGMYLKIGTVEPTTIAYDLIDKFTRNGHLNAVNVFITSSAYAFQLPAVLGNVLLIYKKNFINENKRTEDISFGVSKADALSKYIANKIKQPNIKGNINQSWISPFMILNGLPCRNIKSLFSYTQAIQILQEISMNYSSITPESIYENISAKNAKIPLEEIYNRYYTIDIDYQLSLYRELGESIESDFLIDIQDHKALHNILNTYFQSANNVEITKL